MTHEKPKKEIELPADEPEKPRIEDPEVVPPKKPSIDLPSPERRPVEAPHDPDPIQPPHTPDPTRRRRKPVIEAKVQYERVVR